MTLNSFRLYSYCMDKNSTIRDVYEEYIKGTIDKEHIRLMDVYVASIPVKIAKLLKINSLKIYITTKTLKHIHDRYCYDKKCPEIIEDLVEYMPFILKDPDIIKKNKEGKNAEIVFIKTINDKRYACPLERMKIKKRKKELEIYYVETTFIIKKEGLYLEKNLTFYSK